MEVKNKIEKANLYRFWAECFYQPTLEQYEMLKDESDKFPGLPNEMFQNNESLAAIQVDHAALFVGPFKVLASPYGSIYMEEGNQLYGDSTMDAVRFYQNEQLKINLNEPPDHISIELEYMQYLIAKEVEAIENGNPLLAEEYFDKQKKFINVHLGNWVGDFCDLIIQNSKSMFYATVASNLKTFIRQELNEYCLV